jgi:hypothetical protein
MKYVEYRIKEINDDKITWKMTGEYPYIKTIVVQGRKYIIEKWLFSKFVIETPVGGVIYDDAVSAEVALKKLMEKE